ncbi:MAG: S9 family peptidase, partial [Proteobacteria bacterium]|nr:S9 family peptidase [Pseudomonadota bacterium]
MRKITAALLLAASFSLVAGEADHSKFLNTDVFELEIAADPQISPDGSQVAYVRQSMDIMTDRVRSNIWVVGTNGRG